MENTLDNRTEFCSIAPMGPSDVWLLRARPVVAAIGCVLFLIGAQLVDGGNATWSTCPSSGNWNTAANWQPMTVPNGPLDIATFGNSAQTSISFSASIEIRQISFNSGANAYTITASPAFSLTISGEGITNSSGLLQNFVTMPGAGIALSFRNSANAGSLTAFTNNGGTVSGEQGGLTTFNESASAGNGAFTNAGGLVSGATGGVTQFANTSSAGAGAFVNNSGAASGAGGGMTAFYDTSTAGNGTFTTNGATVSGAQAGSTVLNNNSTAGTGLFTVNGATGSGAPGGLITFGNNSTAGNGTFTINGGAVSGGGSGSVSFLDNSSTGNATFTNNAGVAGADGGTIHFTNSSGVAGGTFINNGAMASGGGSGSIVLDGSVFVGGGTFINNGSPVSGGKGGTLVNQNSFVTGPATLIANSGSGGGGGGEILFAGSSSGQGARVAVFGNGNLDISFHTVALTIGSIEGDGNIFLGRLGLFAGANNISTIFSGVIQDGGQNGGAPGSLLKTGTGTLRLSNANTYTGGTTVQGGRLLANNSAGSATSSNFVNVNNSGSVFGGTGTIAGPVTVNANAALLGGDPVAASGSLKIGNNLTLNSGSVIQLVLGPSGAHSSLTRTGGTWTFAPNQVFSFLDLGAQPGFYDNIITGLAADPGGEGSWVITNAGFTGTFTYDGAGNIDLNLTATAGPALQLVSALSKKTHGAAGTFVINLPLSGEPGLECRSGGPTGSHTFVFTFNNNVTAGNASLTNSVGRVVDSTFSGKTMTVTLTGVADAQKINVTLSNVKDAFSQTLPDKVVSANMLVGDVTVNKVVNSTDIQVIKAQTGAPVNGTNFREDVTVDGSITSSDVSLAKLRSGSGVP
jgi:autotransporter-associated beta strand protein